MRLYLKGDVRGVMGNDASPGSGTLVAVEGIDGSGKSTVANQLCDALRREERLVFETREPTDSYVGTAVREALRDPDMDPVSEALLFAADHARHVGTIREALDDGAVVVSDRYSVSWRVYQSLTLEPSFEASGVDPGAWLDDLVDPFEVEPDLVLVLDLPVERALERLSSRGEALEKFEEGEFLKRVRGQYLALAQERGFVRVDAKASLEEVFETCWEHVVDAVGGGLS